MALLEISLAAAVPLRIAELERLDTETREAVLAESRERDVDLIASKADILLYGGGKSGEVAKVHTALVNALAHLAFAPGGVKFLGMHFTAKPALCGCGWPEAECDREGEGPRVSKADCAKRRAR